MTQPASRANKTKGSRPPTRSVESGASEVSKATVEYIINLGLTADEAASLAPDIERRVLEAYCKTNAAKLIGHIRRTGMSDADVEDCVQHVFLTALDHYDKTKLLPPRQWLLGAANYYYRDLSRRRREQNGIREECFRRIAHTDAEDPVEQLLGEVADSRNVPVDARMSLRELLTLALKSSRVHAAEILALYMKGCSASEIGDRFGLAQEFVERTLYEIRREFQRVCDSLLARTNSEAHIEAKPGANPPGAGGPLPSPEEIESLTDELFTDLPAESVEERRQEVIKRLSIASRKAVAELNSSDASAAPPTTSSSLLSQMLIAALPKEYADRLQLLESPPSQSPEQAVAVLRSVLDGYLTTRDPQENVSIQDAGERRKDLVRQKTELAAEVGSVIERLGLTLCAPSGEPAKLRVVATARNPRGEFRLIPRGSSIAEAGRAHLRDLVSLFRFQQGNPELSVPIEGAGDPSSSPRSSRSR